MVKYSKINSMQRPIFMMWFLNIDCSPHWLGHLKNAKVSYPSSQSFQLEKALANSECGRILESTQQEGSFAPAGTRCICCHCCAGCKDTCLAHNTPRTKNREPSLQAPLSHSVPEACSISTVPRSWSLLSSCSFCFGSHLGSASLFPSILRL